MSYPTFLDPVEREVRDELERQNAKWGEQNHPDYDPHDVVPVAQHNYAFQADRWKQVNKYRADGVCSARLAPADNPCTAWDGILLEEVYEALAEKDPAKRRAELIQVAAVAQQWAAAIDRRESEGK